jgi:hypothetical protein
MTVVDEPVWCGTIYSGARSGGPANLEAFTDTRQATVRGDIAPIPSRQISLAS